MLGNTWSLQKLEEIKNRFCPRAFEGRITLLMSCFLCSGLCNYDRKCSVIVHHHFYYLMYQPKELKITLIYYNQRLGYTKTTKINLMVYYDFSIREKDPDSISCKCKGKALNHSYKQ